jgi:HEAT repeat protein
MRLQLQILLSKIILVILVVIFLGTVSLSSMLLVSQIALAQTATTATNTTTPMANPPVAPPTTPDNTPILVAIIGLASALLVAVIGGGFAIYQMRSNIKAQKEQFEKTLQNQKEQLDKTLAANKELAEMSSKAQISLTEKEAEIKSKQEAEERLRLRKELDDKEEQEKMAQAKTLVERVAAYRRLLHTDTRISAIKILEMSQRLEVKDVYVRLKVQREAGLSYRLKDELLDAEKQHNFDEMVRVELLELRNRTATALEPAEAVRQHHPCVVVGDPGAGKTTLLKYLTLTAADGKLPNLPDLPIYIELNEYIQSGYGNLIDYAAHHWQQKYGFPEAEARDYMEEKLVAGEALLLLDGLDETVVGGSLEEAEASYGRVVKAITELTPLYSKSPMVVTARKASYFKRGKIPGFNELEVLDFSPDDIKTFINNWFLYQPPDITQYKQASSSDLIQKLEHNQRIQRLAANPLLLSLIVIVYTKSLSLPTDRVGLYKACVDTLLVEWDASRRRRRAGATRINKFDTNNTKRLLEDIAWYFHLQGKRYFPEPELLQQIASFLPALSNFRADQNGEILEEIEEEHGLLKAQSHELYGFLHLTLQEYFVSRYAVENNQLEAILDHRADPWWAEVILLYAGGLADGSLLLKRLLGEVNQPKPLREDIFYSNLRLAGRCLASKMIVREVELREIVISRLFEVLRQTSYSYLQNTIMTVLVEIGNIDVKTRATILEILQDSFIMEVFIHPESIEILGELGDRSIVPQLLTLLLNTSSTTFVQEGIATALGKLGDHSIVPQLLTLLLDNSTDTHVRSNIAFTLGKLGERTIVPQLLALLPDNSIHSDVRSNIATALGELGDRSIVPQLLALLPDNSINIHIRSGIARTLGELGDRSIVPQLLALLPDNSIHSDVRSRIAFALGELGDRSIVPQLLALLPDDSTNTYVRRNIAFALGELGDRSIVPQLLSIFLDTSIDDDVRSGIVNALGKLGDRSIVPQLLSIFLDTSIDISIRGSIADALGELGDHSIVPQLLSIFLDTSTDSFMQWRIVKALGLLAEGQDICSQLADVLLNSNVADDIYTALAKVSRRSKVLVCEVPGSNGEKLEVIPIL